MVRVHEETLRILPRKLKQYLSAVAYGHMTCPKARVQAYAIYILNHTDFNMSTWFLSGHVKFSLKPLS